MKETTRTVPELSEVYSLPIHAAISQCISLHKGLPPYTLYDDMYNYVVREMEIVHSISGESYEKFFSDFLIEIQQMLDTKFYATKRGSLKKESKKGSEGKSNKKHDADMRLTSHQEELFMDNMHLVKITINKIIDCNKLDAIISRDDLEQCGLIALNYAVQECVEGKNFKAYAILKIRRAVYNAIADTDQQKNGYVSSLDAILDTEDMPSKVPTSFITESVEDSYEKSNLNIVDILYALARKYPAGSCYRKGIIAIAEHRGNGRSWDELAELFGTTKQLVSAWTGKAEPLLFKNDILREALNLKKYNPDTDEIPKRKKTNE